MNFSLRDFIWAIVCLGLLLGVIILSWQLQMERKNAPCILIRIYDLDPVTLKQKEIEEVYHGPFRALWSKDRPRTKLPSSINPDGRLFLDINVHHEGNKPD